MNWIEELESNLRKRRQILFSRDSEILQLVALSLKEQPHRVVVLWALNLAEETLKWFEENNPKEKRPRIAIEQTILWMQGVIKMPAAKKAILDCHAVAKEIQSAEDVALVHAIGQACSTVHTADHALGLPMYELTALVRRYGYTDCVPRIKSRVQEYVERLIYYAEHTYEWSGQWSDFMVRDHSTFAQSINIKVYRDVHGAARLVRNWMVSHYGDGVNLAGHCIEASDLICDILNLMGYNAHCTEGWVLYDDDSYCTYPYDAHTWVTVELNNIQVYVDVTAEQFNYGMNPEYKFAPLIIQRDLPHGIVLELPTVYL